MNHNSPMQLFTLAFCGLVGIFVVGTVLGPRLIPARFHTIDLVILIPLAFCWRTGFQILDGARRFVFGLAQAILLIYVFSAHWGREIRLGDGYSVFAQWVVLALMYASVFWGLIEVRQSFGQKTKAGHCHQCGYNLTGNVSGRCPECGTDVGEVERDDGEQ